MNRHATQPESPWPHRLAVMLVCATFPLIWVGGLVTTYDAGMAVPDWPSTYGYNLFLYPWQTWLLGPWDLFIEHGHRLLGAGVGMITLAFVGVVFWLDRRPWMRLAAIVALALVVTQGSLGGARVLLDQRQLALVHGCLGPAFFAYTVALAVVTSRLWKASPSIAHEGAIRLHTLAGFTACLAFFQLVVGAHLRHLPFDASPSFFRTTVYFHLLIAALLVLHAGGLAIVIFRQHRPRKALHRPALALGLLIVLQLALGSATWVVKYAWPDWFSGFYFAESYTIEAEGMWQALTVTAHVATGSLILACSVLVTLRAARLVHAAGDSQSVSDLLGSPSYAIGVAHRGAT